MHRSCDILYIHSSKNPAGEDNRLYGIMPMGIIAILNTLRAKGYHVIGVNMAMETILDPQFDLTALLKNTHYKVLMTDLHWYEHSFGAMYVAESSKTVWPEIPVVIGGYTATIFDLEIAEHFSAVDYIVTGDSDLPLEQLTDHLLGQSNIALGDIPNLVYRKGPAIVRSEKTWVQTTLDTLDFVSTDFFDHSQQIPYITVGGTYPRAHPSQWLCIARGCRYNCAYCCGAKDNMPSLFRRCEILIRSPEKVASDFVALADKGLRVSPSHDLQMFGKTYYKEVFSRIRASGRKPGMYLECFQLPTKDFIDEVEMTFDKHHLMLELSPISGNEHLRKANGKMFSNEAFYETVKYIRAKGIALQIYYTVNVVGETKAQFMDTVFQMNYLRVKLGLRSVYYQRVVIDPLAGMRTWDGVNAQYNSFMDYYRYCQIPDSEKLDTTGFSDGCELPAEEKMRTYDTLFSKN